MDYKFLLNLPTDLSKAYIKKMSNAELKECVKQLESIAERCNENNVDVPV